MMSRSLRVCAKPLHLISTMLLLIVMVNVYDSVNVKVLDDSESDIGRSPVNEEHDGRRQGNTDAVPEIDGGEIWKVRLRNQILTMGRRVHNARRVHAVDDVGQDWNDHDIVSLIVPDDCEKDLPLLILVVSSPGNVGRRNAIRQTWARDTSPEKPRYRTVFAMGGTGLNDSLANILARESDKYQDMLIGNYVDTYRNLTVKVLHGLTWTLRSCKPKYLLKTDDDCFVDPDILANDLMAIDASSRNKTRLYVGYRRLKSVVVRNTSSRWYVSQKDYPFAVYPPYASGFGYILSSQTLEDIVEMAADQNLFPVEDAFVGVLAARAKIPLVTSSNFVLPPEGNTTVPPILCQRPYVVHNMTREGAQVLHHQNAMDSRTCRKTNSVLSITGVRSRASQTALFNHIPNGT